ncbi:hypothetical protein [Curtobacterium sp. ISL-83]|uniref:hypothetical protein n=1 Tax=Curtobacterium sp. ISL-83 TaxID=2819145 RepID=UPI001BE8B4FB|nr:hypothetical protein [Curtobacterium sp. ISL-83]MBT2502410.1 hypothetical protein [Curtobacterium sp. ISL-83]
MGLAVLIVLGSVLGLGRAFQMSPGAMLAEAQGKTLTEHYARPDAVPASDRPSWFPATATDITVKQPGENSDVDGLKIDARVPAGTALPVTCTAARYSQAWDGGGTWPEFTHTPIRACGEWRAVLTDGHLYLWR